MDWCSLLWCLGQGGCLFILEDLGLFLIQTIRGTTNGLSVQLKLNVVHPKSGPVGHIGEDVAKHVQ